jgi:hypothetical protein
MTGEKRTELWCFGVFSNDQGQHAILMEEELLAVDAALVL